MLFQCVTQYIINGPVIRKEKGSKKRDKEREGEEGRREGEGKRGRKEYTNRILICGPDRWAGTDNSPALASGITDM